MIAKEPQKTYRFGEPLPAIPGPVTSWPWPGSVALTKWSVDMLKYPLGTLIYDVVDGHPVLAQIQTHTWYGAHPDWPATPHKGTSVFVPTTVDASGKKVAMADPPDGWEQEPAGVGECAPGDPLCTDLPDESAPPPTKKHPMNTVFLNGRPLSAGAFGVGATFPIHPAPPVRRPAPPNPARARAREAVLARAWRPAWGGRPPGFGATRWRPEWGNRPAWFGARQWRREWGAQPAWWGAHLTVQQDAAPYEQDDSQPSDGADPALPAASSSTPAATPDPAAAATPSAGPDAG